jgi:signal transduction histidine kinase
LIGEVIAEVQPKIEEQKLHLVISPMDNLPPVIADIDKIKEVIINFMGNSIKFTPPGGTITVSATSVDGFVKVNVIDTGVGISQDGLSKLFTKFSTVPQETALPLQVYQSTGLGLYISKSIVQMHGGNVWATSDGINKGSTFSFSLPTYTQVTLADMQKKYPAQGLGIIPTTVE